MIRRDGGACELCVLAGGNRLGPTGIIEVDHIRPWSAGGSDATVNLRVLCKPHNRERSNYVDDIGEGRHRIPATWWCLECAAPGLLGGFARSNGPADIDGESGPACDPGGCSTCLTDWWQLADVGHVDEPALAFCAHCDATRYTLWPL